MKPLEQVLRLLNDILALTAAEGAQQSAIYLAPHDDHLHAVLEFTDGLGASHNLVCGLGVDIIAGVVTEEDFEKLIEDLKANVPALIRDNLAQAAAALAVGNPGFKLPVVTPRQERGN